VLENLGNIGDFIGGLAVVLTLIYLARQIRQNTASVQAATVQSAAQANAELMDRFGSDPELLKFHLAGVQDFESLSPDDRARFSVIMGSIMHRGEGMVDQVERGLLPPENLEAAANRLRDTFAGPGTIAWWERGKYVYAANFQRWVDDEIIGTSRKPPAV
jgi:hypothetical protein